MCISRHTSAVLALLFASLTLVPAREKRLGFFNSPKGFGLSLQIDNNAGDEIRTFNLYTDTYGFLSARTNKVGAVFSYTHNYIFRTWDFSYSRLSFYAGAGFLGGYVHDFEYGFFSGGDKRLLTKDMGIAIALDCNAGLGFDFDRGISLDLSYNLAPGVFIHERRDTGEILVGMYKLGIFQILIPQLSIYYRF